ncbi:hypothetical protein Q4601_06055 [Shewanella sp. 1_MG-2023]|uniref:hypothetical protein n=1 Tax=unclassified Shewanella TaxID=196818 RepID=UPI0026E27D12|nr:MULTISPECIES: hypothetical protein [unclassified Shewanella]MDO6611631.1 hypothetical protein [Shewanella sp. 7_MG-2023]MDO6771486.1 hypothetical protein [Shewanella sp. 2_MG-2023]MDO6793865.1 hypothetical protein [Shewanella sp. 1_MG-2023]
MQIQSSVSTQQVNDASATTTSITPAESASIATSKSSASASASQVDSVNLSAQAIALSNQAATIPNQAAQAKQTNSASSEDGTQPSLPNDGEKVENYVHYKKAQAQYQFYSDLAGVANGSDNSMSATSAYMVKNNDDARAATVQAANMNNQQNMLDTYMQTTQSINESV